MEATILSLAEFIEQDLPAPDMVLEPWLPACGLAMVAGPTGSGKTMVTMACAIAIAGGGEFLGWKARKPRRVLYVDGEMSVRDMQERARNILAGMKGVNKELAMKNLFFLCATVQPKGLPSLQRREVRNMLEEQLLARECEVLVLDNLSCLLNSEEENDAASWVELQNWLVSMRRKGFTVVFLHHTGKADEHGNVKQRGTSKREDVLNTTLLINPKTARAGSNRTFMTLVFTKHRGFPGNPVYVTMDVDSDHCDFVLKSKPEPKEKEKNMTTEEAEAIGGGEL